MAEEQRNPPDQSRARATSGIAARMAETKSARIAFIAAMMAEGTFKRGETPALLAPEWNLAVATVEDYAADASRLAKMMTAEYVRARLVMACEKGVGLVEDEIDLAIAGNNRCSECGRSNLDAVKVLPPLVDKYDGLVREKGGAVTINNTVIASLTVEQIRSSPAWRAGLEELSAEWQAMADAVARLESGEATAGELAAAWRALDRAAYGERGDVVEALPVGGGEGGENG